MTCDKLPIKMCYSINHVSNAKLTLNLRRVWKSRYSILLFRSSSANNQFIYLYFTMCFRGARSLGPCETDL